MNCSPRLEVRFTSLCLAGLVALALTTGAVAQTPPSAAEGRFVDRVYRDADPSATWDGILSAQDLVWIQPSDFEVVGIPKDLPGGTAGWYSTKAEYEAQLQTPLGCDVIVQP